MTTFSISPRSVLRVVPFIAKNDIRYYLNGVYVEKAKNRPGVYVAATDGSSMCIDHDPNGKIDGTDSVIIRTGPDLIRACRAAVTKGKHSDEMRVLLRDKRVTVNTADGEACADTELYVMPGNAVIDGKYPDIHRVIPRFDQLKAGFSDHVNSSLLSRFAAVAADRGACPVFGPRGATWMSGIKCWQTEPRSQIIVQMTAIPTMIGVVMPMREDETENRLKSRMIQMLDQPKEAAK